MPLVRSLLATVLVLSLTLVSQAQVDLFNGVGTAVADKAAPETDAQALMTRQLLDYAARGNVERATAIASLARTGRWRVADQLLSGVSGMNLDTPTLDAMYQEIGPALYLKMKESNQLSDTAKSALDQIAAGASASSKSVERMRQAIDALDDPSVDNRLAASRILLSGGTTAISELVSASVAATTTAPRKVILRVLIEFDSLGIDALKQLALYGSPDARGRAMQALGWLDRKSHVETFLTAIHAPDATETEKQVARQQLEMLQEQTPSKESALLGLEQLFKRRQAEANTTDNDQQTATIWLVNPDGRSVTPQTTSALLSAYRSVADAGVRLRRIGGLSDSVVGEVLSADLAYRVMVDPDWGDPEQIEEVKKSYGAASGTEAVLAAIARATELGDHAASIGLMRLITPESATDAERTILLSSGGAKPTSLVMAALNSIPQVRYEAALTASQLAGDMPYAGSSHVRKTLAEMSRLGDEPTAILVETRPDIVIRVETILSSLGYDTVVVRNVSQLQRAVERGGDLRLILSKIELADLPPIEMLDLVRRSPRGRHLPVLFYGPEDPALLWKRWDAPTRRIDLPSSVAAFDEVLDTVRRTRRIPPLSVIDRQSYRAAASPKMAP